MERFDFFPSFGDMDSGGWHGSGWLWMTVDGSGQMAMEDDNCGKEYLGRKSESKF